MRRSLKGIMAAAALAAFLSPGAVRADPDELMGCKIGMVKAPPAAGGLGMTKFVCKGTFALPSAGAAPGYVEVLANPDPPGTSGTEGELAACSGLGNPAGSKGYKCSSGTTPVVLIKTNVVKGVIKLDIPYYYSLSTHPYASPDLRVVLTTGVGGGDTKRYCALFTTPLKNDATLYKSKVAPPPAACSPSGAFLAEDGGLF